MSDALETRASRNIRLVGAVLHLFRCVPKAAWFCAVSFLFVSGTACDPEKTDPSDTPDADVPFDIPEDIGDDIPVIGPMDADADADADSGEEVGADGDADGWDVEEGDAADGEAAECPPLGPGVPVDISLSEAGWHVELFYEGLDLPSGVDSDSDGNIYVGAGLGDYGARAVSRITQAGGRTASAPIGDPDGVAVDSAGGLWVGGEDDIVRVHSLDGASDVVWHTIGGGANINDLAIDTAHGDVVYVGLNDGRVVRVAADGTETEMLGAGDEVSVAVDGSGDVWAVRRNEGTLWVVDHATLAATLAADLTAIRPGLVRVNRIVFGPDGSAYLTAYFNDPNRGTVTRWDPAAPGALEEWVRNLHADNHDPDGARWASYDGCLYTTSPLVGQVLRVCRCP